jgi:hypothetical protein
VELDLEGSLRWVSGPRPDRPPGILEVLTQQRTLHAFLPVSCFFLLLFCVFFLAHSFLLLEGPLPSATEVHFYWFQRLHPPFHSLNLPSCVGDSTNVGGWTLI